MTTISESRKLSSSPRASWCSKTPEERPVSNGRYTHTSSRVLLSDILRRIAQNHLDETWQMEIVEQKFLMVSYSTSTNGRPWISESGSTQSGGHCCGDWIPMHNAITWYMTRQDLGCGICIPSGIWIPLHNTIIRLATKRGLGLGIISLSVFRSSILTNK